LKARRPGLAGTIAARASEISWHARYVLDCRWVLCGPNVETLWDQVHARHLRGGSATQLHEDQASDGRIEERRAQVIPADTRQHYDPAMSDAFFADLDTLARLGFELA
jgi:hypothetical protein